MNCRGCWRFLPLPASSRLKLSRKIERDSVHRLHLSKTKQKGRPKYYELTHTELDGHRMSVLSFPCYMKAIQWPYYRGPARGGGEVLFISHHCNSS